MTWEHKMYLARLFHKNVVSNVGTLRAHLETSGAQLQIEIVELLELLH